MLRRTKLLAPASWLRETLSWLALLAVVAAFLW